ncbi:MAG: hypothetical protein K6E61_03070 [Bacteroidales bacterium]|nr:hypothetical protein [Bacteroidales bacterium]
MKLWKLILPALALVACTRNPALREAARLVESYPDSALTILEGVSPKDLSPRDKAEYDYLSAQAFYNTYFFLDDGHSINLARAYRYKEQQRSRTSNIAMLIAAILATLVLYFWARKAQTEKQLLIQKEENDRLLSAAEELRSRMGNIVKSEKKQGSTFDALDRLCEQYYIYEGTENLQPRIIREVKSIVEGLRSDSSVQKNLEQSLNSKYPGVMTRLRTEFPKWKEEDYLLYLFSASGFSSTTISTLLEKEKPYIYNRIYRLKERIKDSDTTDKGLFLSLLS